MSTSAKNTPWLASVAALLATLGGASAVAVGCGDNDGSTGSATSGGTCGAGFSDCDGACRDVKYDANNCGACGNTCSAAEICSDGQCKVTCQGGTVLCDNECVSTSFDPKHCGDCETACPDGEVCSLGSCGVSCAGGTTLCGALCADTSVDPAHCGDCATACNEGESCVGGDCVVVCGSGTTLCGAACVDTAVDPANCGDCEKPCDAGEVCSGGQCDVSCGGGTTLCNGLCVDTQTDEANCGDCDAACGDGQICSKGNCCPPGLTYCNGTCTDPSQSPVDCGACGVVCGAGDICLGGACTPSPLFAVDGRGHVVGNLYTIDPATGQTSVVAPLHYSYAGLAFLNGILFGASTEGIIFQINPATGAERPVTGIGSYGPRDLAARPDGLLLMCNENHDFVTVDPLTQAPATLAADTCSHGMGFANALDGTIYLADSDALSTIDANAQLSFQLYLSVQDTFKGLSFHHGTLYGFQGGVEGGTPTFVSIDVGTGIVTPITDVDNDLHALASGSL